MQPPTSIERFNAGRRDLFLAKADTPIEDGILRSARDGVAGILDAAAELLIASCGNLLQEMPRSIRLFASQGTFHRLYLVEFDTRPSVVLRVGLHSGLGPAHGFEVEREAARIAAERGVPVPRVLAVDLSRQSVPFDLQIVERAEGRTLRELDDDEAETRRLLGQLASLLLRLHVARVPGYGLLGLDADERSAQVRGVHRGWLQYLRTNLLSHVAICRRIGACDALEERETLNVFDRFDPGGSAEHALLHGDPGGQNALVDDTGKIVALLDWEDALAGDPLFDVAMLASFHPERRHDAIWSGYGLDERAPPEIGVRLWSYFLRIAFAKTVHRHRFGYADRPGRQPAARRIQLALRRLADCRNRGGLQ